MQLQFYKYQGTGNDFVMIDNRSDFFPKENGKYFFASMQFKTYRIDKTYKLFKRMLKFHKK